MYTDVKRQEICVCVVNEGGLGNEAALMFIVLSGAKGTKINKKLKNKKNKGPRHFYFFDFKIKNCVG